MKPSNLAELNKKLTDTRFFYAINTFLLLCFVGGIYWLWFKLPEEGVKLHGTVDIGVDLFGNRNDLVWLASLGLLIYLGNSILAVLLRKRENIATRYLLIATGLILVLLIGTVIFLVDLNLFR